MATPPLGLPAIPPELKPLAPYLQRAEEVKSKDPIIAYWCTYYAAQQGISLKVKSAPARTYLFELLGALEKMKSDIGQSDTLDDENASSAYVENFALRVFAVADNEDRRGQATRATAKKFLAAANFLEVLSVVSTSTPTTIDVPEKIKYAKWKAADIAKAFREGRKPKPGGANEPDPSEVEQDQVPNELPTTPPAIETNIEISGGSASPPSIHRSTPPPPPISNLTRPSPPSTPGHLAPQGFVDPRTDPTSPGAWSTAATPGTPLRRAWVSEEDDQDDDGAGGMGVHVGVGPAGPEEPPLQLPSPPSSDGKVSAGKKVHFTPSVLGGLTPSELGPEDDPFVAAPGPSAPTFPGEESTPSAPPFDEFVKIQPPPSLPPPPIVPPHIPAAPPTLPTPPSASFPSRPPPPSQYIAPQARPASSITSASAASTATDYSMSTVTQTSEELTPQVVSRVQKHCKFAISALDYEDAEQARKELRAALKLLGG